jgi:signal transduction histidine kinase
LPPDSAVIFGLMFADSTGRQFTTAEAQDIITDASTVPVYIHADTQLGRGALGGFVGTLESAGTSAADLTLEVMRGAHPGSLPVRGAQEVNFRVDARALKRWGIPEDRLPPDSVVLYREPTLWQLYRNQVIAALAVIVLQSVLLVALTIQVFRRRRAETALRSATGELARVSRVTTMGEMAASIAHEVNQPLAAIVNYASAGLRWLGHATPNVEEARANFHRISQDGLRAADIITTVRSMFSKQSGEMSKLDLEELVSGVLALTHGEIVDSGAVLRTSYETDLPRIRGDRVQLQQVVLNLVTNAIEAMQPMPSDRRKLSISITRSGENTIALEVADSGPGIPPEAVERIFDSFYTTKQKGLGMGLSICRSIIQAHNGALTVVDTSDLGTRFRVTLPVDEV